MDDATLLALAESPWLLPALLALVIGDAFLVVLPSETLVVALGAVWAATGSPALLPVIVVAAAGAVSGDALCFALGRRIGLDRWRWQRTGRIRHALDRTRGAILTRTAVLVLTARYVPFARIAVNLAAGASGLPLRRFLPLSALAGLAWAVYNVAVGAAVGAVLADAPLLAVGLSIVVAIALGLTIDTLVARSARRRNASRSTPSRRRAGIHTLIRRAPRAPTSKEHLMTATRLEPGTPAPAFTLPDKDGAHVSLADFAGQKVVLYFYPAASTPGCTTQACDFRDNLASLRSAGYTVLGVSKDGPDALQKFAEEEHLPFPLLSDPDLAVHNAYGTYGEKSMYGKTVMGVIRSTFVIDETGAIEHALYNVKATGHVASLRKKLGLD